ncbi:ABC transporter permease [Longispora fulva]|uniref:Peptide/nickel transport system permease protein n=1 Tax=Longispora fulva TaxID=619741 RepID=A0A8J7GHR6_9ACTN|nr:ABC transporter permease [Longispora fulva]MBG6139404.1 peptide/nickel transport system permease protein [Longispora fulva]GIG58903.1 ABC transporter permease [Longispora fulva]
MSRKKDRIDQLAELAGTRAETGESLWRVAFKRVRRSPTAIVGAVIIAVFLLIALLGPLFAPHDPVAQTWRGDISESMGLFPGPRSGNLLGVDSLGRDEFSRLVIGARISLLVGVLATVFGLVIGAALGIASGTAAGLGGRVGGWIDSVIMRFIDILLSVPGLLLAISLAAMIGNGLPTVMIAVGTINVPIFARLLRGSMLAQAHSDYVLASTALGVRKPRIVFSHIVPNSIAPVIVQATLTLAVAIIEAAGLSFLGLGNANSSYPEWGVMLADAQRYLSVAPRLSIFPAVAIIITALGFTLLGESMREALDPKLRR